MTYFAVLGKNTQISMAELELIQPKNLKKIQNNIITFDSNFPEHIAQLGGIIKWGKVINKEKIPEILTDKKIIGVNDENVGKKFKTEYKIKRYKLIKLFHTDKEIKNKGIEIIQINKEQFGIVQGYQNIHLYENIDFGKPARSMQMGMLPAKLAHIMINIGLSKIPKSLHSQITIYDPFVGTGTIGFLANYFAYHFIGSDIKTDYVKQNFQRRTTTKFYNKNFTFDIFTHDITQPLHKKIQAKNILIITEGYLGPIVKKSSTNEEIQKFQKQVCYLYQIFLKRIQELGALAVFTIPRYLKKDNNIESRLTKYAQKIGLKIQAIPEIYARKDQYVGRKILISMK